jgi:hypothetical protein
VLEHGVVFNELKLVYAVTLSLLASLSASGEAGRRVSYLQEILNKTGYLASTLLSIN